MPIPRSHRTSSSSRRFGAAVSVVLGSTIILAGCITGNEAAEAQAPPSPQERLRQLETDHELGIVSDFEYERIKARLKAEIRNQ